MNVDHLNALSHRLAKGGEMFKIGQDVLKLVVEEIQRVKDDLTQDELRELMTAVERAKHDQIKVEGSINKSYKNVALVENVTEPDFNKIREEIIDLKKNYRQKKAYLKVLNTWISQCEITAKKWVRDLYSKIEEQLYMEEETLNDIEEVVLKSEKLVKERLQDESASIVHELASADNNAFGTIAQIRAAFVDEASSLTPQSRYKSAASFEAQLDPVSHSLVRPAIVNNRSQLIPTIEVDGLPLIANLDVALTELPDTIRSGGAPSGKLLVPSTNIEDHSVESGVSITSACSAEEVHEVKEASY
ncbi:uncharacterized protein LOC111268070 isoform X3 [Varroa jacobsoni]|uniref:Uncharacterized protein n=1 Tax=Varroa destructor TaxID=109461 RepID=A0A7M7MF17_VARDE|nr:uncharacterized protein LOC111248647 isoform X2 [Varroa destructor]XP_022702530.1 uncharacterized protein LOC111268070 isoform X3 [Varroa jacobsoni]